MRRSEIASLAGSFLALVWIALPAGAVAEAEPGDADSIQEEAPAPPAEAAEASAVGAVLRAVVTHGVTDREPHDKVENVGTDTDEIFYFTELSDLTGHMVIHRWEQGGEVRAEVAFDVEGPRWRVFSSKKLDPSWQGEWTVSVIDQDGSVMHQDRFDYREAAPTPASAAPAAPVP